MSETLPTGEEEQLEPQSIETDLGLTLSDEERADAEQMVARLRSEFGLDDSEESVEGDQPEPSEPEPEEEPEPQEPEQPESPAEPVAKEDDWISIDGRAVPVAEARSMLELRQYLAQNPDKAAAVRAAIEGTPEAEPPSQSPAPPEWLDLEDPSQRFFWEQQQRLEKQVTALAQNQQREAEERARSDAMAQVNSAMTTFRTNHPELTEDEVQIVRTHAVALNIIPGLQQGRSGTDAVLKALDIAYLDHPEFRARQTGQPSAKQTKQAESKERKQKLAGIAGSGTSAPRSPEPPQRPGSDREMRSQAAKWLSEQGIL